MHTGNSVLKPPTLTFNDHNYASTHMTDTPVKNGKHSILEDTRSPPPIKRFLQDQPLLDSNSMDTENLADSDNQTNNDFTLAGSRKNKSSSSRVHLTNHRYKTVIHNRFDSLPATGVDCEPPSSSKTNHIPPIFLHDSNNYQALIADLNKILKNDYYTVNKGSSIKINVSTSDDFRALTAHFDSVNVQYHSFCPPENKRLSVIMRNVPISLTDDEILTELKVNRYPVLKVSRLYNKEKCPMPLCAIELEDSESGNDIFALEFLFHSKIQIELKRKAKSIPQCTRCQRFGHTKNYCRLQPRCVKCTGDHLYSVCPKKKEDPVQCVNCGEAHAANYRGCSYYLKLKSRLSQHKNDKNDCLPVNSNKDQFCC